LPASGTKPARIAVRISGSAWAGAGWNAADPLPWKCHRMPANRFLNTRVALGVCLLLGITCASLRAADTPIQAAARSALEQKLYELDHPTALAPVTAAPVAAATAQPAIAIARVTGTAAVSPATLSPAPAAAVSTPIAPVSVATVAVTPAPLSPAVPTPAAVALNRSFQILMLLILFVFTLALVTVSILLFKLRQMKLKLRQMDPRY